MNLSNGLKNEELKKVVKFQAMLKEIFYAFPHLKSIKITNVGSNYVDDFIATSPEDSMMHVSSIDLETKNKTFSELNYVDQKKDYEEIMREKIVTKDLNKLAVLAAIDARLMKDLNKLVSIAAVDAKLIKKKMLSKETKNNSASHEYVFISEEIKNYILNRKFNADTNKKLGSDEFKNILSKKPRLY